jgi:hypothetical protein
MQKNSEDNISVKSDDQNTKQKVIFNSSNKSGSKTLLIVLIILGILFFIVTTILLSLFTISTQYNNSISFESSQSVNYPTNTDAIESLSKDTLVQPEVLPVTGTISGILIYPSDFIPPQIVCAIDINTNDEFCTSSEYAATNIGKYSLDLPASNYYVYAKISDSQDLGEDILLINQRIWYNSNSNCIISGCGENYDEFATPSVVQVEPNQTLQDINPIDWYSE